MFSEHRYPGYVYIMCHPRLPHDWIKIGCSRSPFERARALAQTGLPHPYEVVFARRCRAPYRAERQVFTYLDAFRVQGNREFFCVAADKAQRVINEVVDHINYGITPEPEVLFDEEEIERLEDRTGAWES